MRRITFIPEDFETLDVTHHRFQTQFESNKDCPMTRAIRRSTNNPVLFSTLHGEILMEKNESFETSNVFMKKFSRDVIVNIAKYVEKNGSYRYNLGTDLSELVIK